MSPARPRPTPTVLVTCTCGEARLITLPDIKAEKPRVANAGFLCRSCRRLVMSPRLIPEVSP